MNKKNKKTRQKQTPSTGDMLSAQTKSIKGASGNATLKKSVLVEKKEELQRENASLTAMTVELQRSLRASKLQLNDFSEESAATIELLKLHLTQLQERIDSTTHKHQDHLQALILEKEMLHQQNEQLQEQLDYYFLEHKRAMGSIDSLSSLVKHAPRLQLLHAANSAGDR